ncbi:MAG: Lpg1974 family pore-forming outer membrane protein [Chlamydiales bacterium]
MKTKIKRLALFFITSWILCSSHSMSAYPGSCCGSNGCNMCEPSCFDGIYAIYENVILKPYFSRNFAYYLEEPSGVGGQKAVMFDWCYQYSPRIEIGWIVDCGMGGRVRYWRFHNDNSLTASNDDGEIAVFYGEDSITPDIGFSGAERAKFCHRLELDVVDFELIFERCYWTYSTGGRYVDLEQHYKAQELEPNDDSFTAKHRFEGGGITTAVEYFRPIWCGFSFFTKARGSLLYGDSNFRATVPSGESAITSSNDTDVIAVGELQLGLDWRTSICNVCTFLRFAIETQYWIGGGSAGGPGDNAVYDEGNYQNSLAQDANLGFFGFNIAIGFAF